MRIKRGTVSHRKHTKLRSLTKGYRGTKSTLVRKMTESVLHAGKYAYQGRKDRKGDFRRLWITRIGEAVKQEGISYSVFMSKLKKANIELDRKSLSLLVTTDLDAFKHIVQSVKNS